MAEDLWSQRCETQLSVHSLDVALPPEVVHCHRSRGRLPFEDPGQPTREKPPFWQDPAQRLPESTLRMTAVK